MFVFLPEPFGFHVLILRCGRLMGQFSFTRFLDEVVLHKETRIASRRGGPTFVPVDLAIP